METVTLEITSNHVSAHLFSVSLNEIQSCLALVSPLYSLLISLSFFLFRPHSCNLHYKVIMNIYTYAYIQSALHFSVQTLPACSTSERNILRRLYEKLLATSYKIYIYPLSMLYLLLNRQVEISEAHSFVQRTMQP